jgi:hypothetical protein
MSQELDRVLERVRQNRARALETLTPRTPSRAATTTTAPGGFTPGAPVFDTVTGQHGEVIGGSRENVIRPSAERADH